MHFATPIHRQSFKPIPHYLPTLQYYKDKGLVNILTKQLVACCLIKNGHEIFEMNYSVDKIGMVDIISKNNNIVMFTEVKAQIKSKDLNRLESQIDEYNIEQIMNFADLYMKQKKMDTEIGVNVAEVILGEGKPKIDIIKMQ